MSRINRKIAVQENEIELRISCNGGYGVNLTTIAPPMSHPLDALRGERVYHNPNINLSSADVLNLCDLLLRALSVCKDVHTHNGRGPRIETQLDSIEAACDVVRALVN